MMSAVQNQARDISANGYCPRCGNPLAQDAKFCQSCGNLIPVASSSGQTTITTELTTEPESSDIASERDNINEITQRVAETHPSEEQSYAADGCESEAPSVWEKYKWYFVSGTAVLIAAISLFFLLGRDSDKEIGKKYVYMDNTKVFRITDGELGEDPIADLDFGQEVSVLASDSLWVKVAVVGKKGYVAFSDLMDWEDFNPLKHALSDNEMFLSAPTRYHRRALSAEFKGRKDASLENLEYCSSFDNGYYQNVAMIVNDTSRDIREYIIYGFPEENGTAERLYSEVIPYGMSEVKDAIYKNGKYKITYKRAQADIQKLEGADVYTGYIDGKYEIVMNLINYGSHYRGVYYYTKNGNLIDIEGDVDENGQLTLTETVSGNVTGQFIGEYSLNEFSGYWISADGERSLIFRLDKN